MKKTMFHYLSLNQRSLRGWNGRIKLFLLFSTTIFIYCFLNSRRSHKEALNMSFFKENVKFLDGLNNTECKLPQYNIYDEKILPYITKPPSPIECSKVQPYLTYLDWDGVLHINKTEVNANYVNVDIRCFYQSVSLNKENDYEIEYSDEKVVISFPQKITHPTIKVQCLGDGSVIYIMVHTHIAPLDPNRIESNKKIPRHRPSILIFGIDSMSRGNFIRTLPATYNYLLRMGITVFKGLNKVADNTFPNMLALLAGFTAYVRKGVPVPLWTPNKNSTIKGYDEMPIVWKTLRQQGFITMYCEEYLDTIFSYMDFGFREDPVDYYYRAPYVSLKQSAHFTPLLSRLKFWNMASRRYCLNNEPSYRYMLNYTEEFLTEMADLRYFALSFFVEMSHEYLTDVANMDEDLKNFFTRMFSKGYLDNTVVIVMGDHGHRFDKIRSTYIGKIEERMPFMGMILPKGLKEKYPHLQSSLQSHTDRLLSWYDIHQTLMDIVDDDLGQVQTAKRPGAVGRSIFRKFNEARTCTEIGILPEYCVCDREASIPTDSDKALLAADVAVNHINDLLVNTSNSYIRKDFRMCAHLTLKNVTLAFASMKSYSSGLVDLIIKVMFYTLPGEGMFDAAVTFKPDQNGTVLGDISRINKYGNQPSCISHEILRLYCYCIDKDVSEFKDVTRSKTSNGL